MKFISKILMLSFLSFMLMIGCKKDENQIFYTGGTAPVLKSSLANGAVLPLTEDNKDLTALKFSWTNPNYTFTTGVSSQDVTYTIEIDTTGSNFSNPNKKEYPVIADLSKEITYGDLNKFLVVEMKLKAEVNHEVEFRLKSSFSTGAGALYSNVFKYTIKPYAIVKVPLPAGGDLFLVGNATPGGWSNPVPVPNQKFTKTGATSYEITVALSANAYFLILPENGSWSKKYAVTDNTLVDLWKGGDFQLYSSGGQDIPGPPAAGNYKITVDFQEGKFAVIKL